MARRIWIVALVLWPGFAQIWLGQEILGLLIGVFFGLAVNLALVGRWIWFEAFPPRWPDFFAFLATAIWLAGLVYTVWWIGFCHPDRHRAEIDRLFREAQEAYLQGRWVDSERRVEQILARDESDADALLLLGSICARAQRLTEARRALRQCLDSKGGAKWRWEVQQALARIADG
jgi:hypothetical protein